MGWRSVSFSPASARTVKAGSRPFQKASHDFEGDGDSQQSSHQVALQAINGEKSVAKLASEQEVHAIPSFPRKRDSKGRAVNDLRAESILRAVRAGCHGQRAAGSRPCRMEGRLTRPNHDVPRAACVLTEHILGAPLVPAFAGTTQPLSRHPSMP